MNGCIYDFNFPLTLRSTEEHAKHLNLYTKRVTDMKSLKNGQKIDAIPLIWKLVMCLPNSV